MRDDGSMTTPSPVRVRRTWDLVLTIVLLVLLAVVSVVAAVAAFGLGFSDSCGASTVCDYDRIGEGFIVGIVAPLAIGFIALVVTIVTLIRRRLSFWIPLLGIMLAVGAEVAAYVWAYGNNVPMLG